MDDRSAAPTTSSPTHRLGIDIGGTGVKAAPVDVSAGRLLAERRRIPTPQPSVPPAVAAVAAELARQFAWTGDVGVAFPAVVQHGVARTAANIDAAWIGTDVAAALGAQLAGAVTVINDADAAGLAEMRFGAGRDRQGVVVLATLGTGIGTAVFLNGQLVPNTELGHLELDGHDAETRASEAARERENLSWEKWATRLTRYFSHLEALLWPDLIIVGGGVSKKAHKFLPLINVRTPLVAAQMRNEAGIVGAAVATLDHPVDTPSGGVSGGAAT